MSIMSKIKLLFCLIGKQISVFFKNCFTGIAKIPKDRKEFGLKIALVKYVNSLLLYGNRKWYIRSITKYLTKELSVLYTDPTEIIEEPTDVDFNGKIPVWMCWWQGPEAMPDVVKACIQKVKSSIDSTHCLVLIDQWNYDHYASIPTVVLEKNRNGQMCIAHMADVLRIKLLALYGGVWIDATCFIQDARLLKCAAQYSFYSPKLQSPKIVAHESSRGKWCTFLLSGEKNNKYFSYVYNALVTYWERHEYAIDYTLLDYVMYIGYAGNRDFSKMVDECQDYQDNIWDLLVHMNGTYVSEKYNALVQRGSVFKLSHREPLATTDNSGKDTIYAHWLKEIEITL